MSRHQPSCLTAQQCACTAVVVMRCLFCVMLLANTPALAQGTGAAAGSPDEASPDDASLTEQASDYMRDYLSDSRRVGSLVGNIIGGALTAHPAGPIVGGLVGFFVGKSSLFSEGDQRASQATRFIDPRRPIVPEPGQAVTGLSFGAGQPINFSTAPPAAIQPGGVQVTSVVPVPAPEVLTMTPASPQPPTAMHQVTPASQPAPVRQQPLPAMQLPSVKQQTAPTLQASPAIQQTAPALLPPVTPQPAPAPAPTRIAQEPVRITPQAAPLALPTAPLPRGFSREQIAQLCSGRLPGASDPRLKNICFYYQTN